MKRFVSLALLLLFLLASAFMLDFFTGYSVHRDLIYDDERAMDIYLPSDTEGISGAVLFIHGGGWMSGDKSEEDIRCRIVANGGYVAATLNYTLLTDETEDFYTIDLVMDEIDLAIERLVEVSAEQGIDIQSVALSGYSAGGHIALLYAYTRAEDAPLDVAFVSSMAGPADISYEVWGGSAAVIGSWLSGEEVTAEMAESGEADEILSLISPVANITPDSPPTMLIQGARDNVVPPRNAESLVAHLQERGVDYDSLILSNSDHSLLQNPLGHLSYYLLLLNYCGRYLK